MKATINAGEKSFLPSLSSSSSPSRGWSLETGKSRGEGVVDVESNGFVRVVPSSPSSFGLELGATRRGGEGREWCFFVRVLAVF